MFETAHHPVFNGANAYDKFSKYLRARDYDRIFLLTDSNCRELCLPLFEQKLSGAFETMVLEIPAGESYKTLETCNHLWQALLEHHASRKSVLINLGGGVVTDLGGFVAATFKRGIDFIHIPTTLLGQVDAAIGGKTGVDFHDYKNMIGSFTQPQAVLIDPDFLRSLNKRQFISGLAEVLKYGLIADAELWNELKTIPLHELDQLEPIIKRCIQLKVQFTDRDFEERGIRKALNFGHTFGHAIETLFLRDEDRPTHLHGEAIAAGMICELDFNVRMGKVDPKEAEVVTDFIFDVFPILQLHEEDFPAIADLMLNDKKNSRNTIFVGMLNGIGQYIGEQSIDGALIDDILRRYTRLAQERIAS
jgi:3-dehydroquinate synthase